MSRGSMLQLGGFTRMPALAQLGLLVRDMDAAAVAVGSALGVKTWYRSRIASQEVFYRGRPTTLDWDIVVGYSGRVQVELIEVREAGENVYHEVLGETGEGLHHLGVVVRGLDRRLAALGRAGMRTLQSGTIRFAGGAVTRFAYLDTFDAFGFILELIETRVYGINLGMPRWLLQLGTITGDVVRIGPDASRPGPSTKRGA